MNSCVKSTTAKIVNTLRGRLSKSSTVRLLFLSIAISIISPSKSAFGALYVSAPNGSGVVSLAPSGTLYGGLSDGYPRGLAFDSAGNLYVATSANHRIYKIDQTGSLSIFSSIFTSGLHDPFGLAFDAQGFLYVSNLGNDSISKIASNGIGSAFIDSEDGINAPTALAFDATGYLYIANNSNSKIYRASPAGIVDVFVDSPLLNDCQGLAFDSGGNLFASTAINSSILKITPSASVSVFADASDGLIGPKALAFNSTGTLYVGHGAGLIAEINQSGLRSNYADIGNNASFGLADSSVQLPVPEPSASLLLIGGACFSLLRRLRANTPKKEKLDSI